LKPDGTTIDSRQAFRPALMALNWLWSVFVSLLVIVAFLAILYFTGARDTWLWLNSMTWDKTQCEINQVFSGRKENTETGSTSVSVSFKVSATYSYNTDYGSFVGNRYDFRGIFRSSYQAVKNDLNYLRSNSTVPCYYNPGKPEQSVINRSFQADFLIALIPFLSLGAFPHMAICSLARKFGIKKTTERVKRGFLPDRR